jgi:hypothetical protein
MSSAFFLKDMELEGFHRASAEFEFPLEVGIPGRVWKHRNFAWHGNIVHATQYNIAQHMRISIAQHMRISSLNQPLSL